MCDLYVDLDEIAARHGTTGDLFGEELASLAGLEEDGVVLRTGNTLTITPLGRPLVRAVAASFDRYLKAGEQRHSKAV